MTTDFFVSYNQHDRAWAEWIAWQLESASYSTVIQAWDWGPGSNFVIAMHDGLAKSDRVLLVLSTSYLKSGFGKAEWAAIFSADSQGHGNRVLPVRVQDCNPDGLLAALVYIDLVGKDAPTARETLLAGVTKGRRKPAVEPVFPGGAGPAFPPDASAVSASPVTDSVEYVIVLSGTVDEVDRPMLEAIAEHLRKIARDSSLTIRRVQRGSISLVIVGSRSGLTRLRDLFDSGGLSEIGGFRVERIQDDLELVAQSIPMLMRVARYLIASSHSDLSMEPGDLVNEAYVDLVRLRGHSAASSTDNVDFVMSAAVFMRSKLLHGRSLWRYQARALRRTSELRDTVLPPEQESQLLLDELLAQLPEVDAALIEMRYLAGLTFDEIGRVLKISQGAARVRFYRALKQLKRHYTGDVRNPSNERTE